MIRLWRTGRLDLEGTITRQVDLSKLNDAFDAMERRGGRAQRDRLLTEPGAAAHGFRKAERRRYATLGFPNIATPMLSPP